MELKILVAFIFLINTIQCQDYCNKSLCKGRNHVACGHSGVTFLSTKLI